jgi:hypothetical protein
VGKFESEEEKDAASLRSLLVATSEVAIAKGVAIYHDTVRVSYPFYANKVESFENFTKAVANYYSYHFSQCYGKGLSQGEVSSRSIRILEQEYRERGGDLFAAYKDARDGTNGGLAVILDRIAEHLKAESIERYIQDVFEKCMSPISRKSKVEMIRQFIARNDQNLPSSVLNDQPERYADNYHELIKAYIESLKNTSRIFRILPAPSKSEG